MIAVGVRVPAAIQLSRVPVAALGAGLLVGGLGLAEGGYFPTSWGFVSLPLLWGCALALVVSPRRAPRGLELALVGGLGVLTAWIALSALWSSSPARPLAESQRTLLYLALALASVLVLSRAAVGQLLGGVLAGVGVICAYGLATRLFPERLGTFDPIAGYRLAEPVGYWNGLGLLAAMGTVLAVGAAARAQRRLAVATAAALVPLFLVTLTFTFARGPWLALGLGLAIAFAVDPRRLQLTATATALAPVGAIAVWLAARSPALTRIDSALEEASREGHRLASLLVALMAGSALLAVLVRQAERRIALGSRARLSATALLAVLGIAAVAVGLVRVGGPVGLYESFEAPPPRVDRNLTERLFSLSGNGRADLWRAAIDQSRERPLLGGGAGSFEAYWLEHRDVPLKVRDGHSLYLEALAELGPVGLAGLLLALGAPLLAAWRARHEPLAGPTLAAYAAFLGHAAVDWDWELPAVTCTGVLLGVVLLLLARREERPRRLSPVARVVLCASATALGAWALVGLVGANALASATDAAGAGNFDRAAAEARRAAKLAPWSPAPWQALGRALLAEGDDSGAAAAFRRAIELDPSAYEPWLDLARALEGAAREDALGQAQALNPLSPEIARFRAELAAETRAPADAPEVTP